MLTTIRTMAFAAGVSAIALGGAASADDPIQISGINVETSVSAAAESNGIQFYPDLAEDVRAEVAKRVPLSSDGADPEINIGIRKIALNGATMLGDDRLFNQLEGVVDITSPTGENSGRSFSVKVAAASADQIVPEGYVAVPPSEADFYAAMVSTFADVVAEGLAKVNTSSGVVDP
ncbi:hypothetical protein HTT03_09475 [Sulfitobacter sp. S0837]|uniref:hypothetical protein n=1 Tax=Sulfitobacter maritimus TaxID=2741719 RepID=UPI001583CC4C|nr:hypothetical protein [Sulfitobacter maritimus]NUH65515.1 hypothetical protein [Sulfitobacter maritimus]